MRLPMLIISIPIALIFFVLGLLCIKNKLDFKTYGLESFFNVAEDKEKQEARNKLGGAVFVIFAVVLILLPFILA